MRRPESNLWRDGAKFFDAASLALVATDTRTQAGEPPRTEWNALVDTARDGIASILAPTSSAKPRYEAAQHVALFSNTTAALGRILSRVERRFEGNCPTLLTTDLEYPGCVVAMDDAWTGPVVMALVNDLVMSGTRDPDDALHEAVIRAHNFVKPRVVLLSHVMRTTGQELSMHTLRHLRETNPSLVIVLDGSQAAGNIVIGEEILSLVDFYIASGHKWLGGTTTSGFVWGPELDRWHIDDPAQSVAYRSQLGGSGNSAAWQSLARSIGDMIFEDPRTRLEELAGYSRWLGRRFAAGLAPIAGSVNVVTPLHRGEPPSGLVTIGVADRDGLAVSKVLKEAKFEFTTLADEDVEWRADERFLVQCDPFIPAIKPARKCTFMRSKLRRAELRFCFHYWHTERDVRALSETIVTAVGARPVRRQRGLQPRRASRRAVRRT